MKKNEKKIEVGDVFVVPISNGRFGFGSVLRADIELFIVVYAELFDEPAIPQGISVSDLTPLFAGRTSDGLFFHGIWKVVLSTAPDSRVPLPRYVVNGPDGLVLKNFDGEYLRHASKDDLDFYGYQKAYSNVTFVNALEATHGGGSAITNYLKISVDLARQRSKDRVHPDV